MSIIYQIMLDTTTHFIKENNFYAFRGSSLPYCPTREALTIILNSSDRTNLPTRKTAIKFKAMAEIGELLHRILQDHMPNYAQLYGNWKCHKCNHIVEKSLGPLVHCNRQMQYMELRISNKETGFFGDPDIILYDNQKQHYILCDIKTKDYLETQNPSFHPLKYILQLFAYKYFLTKPPYNLNIQEQYMIYVLRNDITKYRIESIEHTEKYYQAIEKFISERKLMMSALMDGNLSQIEMLCKTPKDEPYCPYSTICFGPNRLLSLESLWKESNFNGEKEVK